MKMNRKTDEEMLREVTHEIQWDSRLAGSEIAVAVRDGTVTLAGSVRHFAAKLAAEEAAHRVHGVLDVANDLMVKASGGGERTDTEIAQAVRRALEWDALVDHQKIHSTVANGWVTLSGTVGRLRERDDVEHAISHLAGVRGLVDEIDVAGPPVDVDRVRKAIEDALKRHAEHGAKHIRVSVEDARVKLSGTVESWLEKRAVLGMVGHLPGVRSVDDEIRVG